MAPFRSRVDPVTTTTRSAVHPDTATYPFLLAERELPQILNVAALA